MSLKVLGVTQNKENTVPNRSRNWPWGRVQAPEPRFWMVFHEGRDMKASVRHTSLESATQEAQRLAQNFPGERFYVASFTGYAQVNQSAWFEMENRSNG